ncbi:hypothetical protein GCM10010981_30480 [Dyella nitratireducens]|uniref:Uncharacterized protein n=1 Tax=Dyella nitratireducens TaxID=1849580 RepID=A0ABQ1G941_9GAMM|nr:hypothetical protein GCM10010981_30480 [Dyella nitratireducens]GLQ40405.1 hypothetical protein GCM10007902_02540 [Dyella nitratireducens]
MGCERSERRESHAAAMHILEVFGYTLKHKQPHPSPPLLPQGREPTAASDKPRKFFLHFCAQR